MKIDIFLLSMFSLLTAVFVSCLMVNTLVGAADPMKAFAIVQTGLILAYMAFMQGHYSRGVYGL